MGGKEENGWVVSPESVSIHFNSDLGSSNLESAKKISYYLRKGELISVFQQSKQLFIEIEYFPTYACTQWPGFSDQDDFKVVICGKYKNLNKIIKI